MESQIRLDSKFQDLSKEYTKVEFKVEEDKIARACCYAAWPSDPLFPSATGFFANFRDRAEADQKANIDELRRLSQENKRLRTLLEDVESQLKRLADTHSRVKHAEDREHKQASELDLLTRKLLALEETVAHLAGATAAKGESDAKTDEWLKGFLVDSKSTESKLLEQRFELVAQQIAQFQASIRESEEKVREEMAERLDGFDRELSAESERRVATTDKLQVCSAAALRVCVLRWFSTRQRAIKDSYATMSDTLESTARALKKQSLDVVRMTSDSVTSLHNSVQKLDGDLLKARRSIKGVSVAVNTRVEALEEVVRAEVRSRLVAEDGLREAERKQGAVLQSGWSFTRNMDLI